MSLPQKSKDFSSWYNELIMKARLADYGPVRGTMIFRPLGFAIWEAIQKELDKKIKEAKVENVYFPLFIPESFLKKEKEHLEGFSPELAVVTIGGGEKLAEPLVVRPTSETIMYASFAKWISSWRDLPLKINQWCNVVRWEKRPYLFLRTTEFLWQEGHTAHETHEEDLREVFRALKMYENFYKEFLGLAGVSGMKSQKEKFAGAVNTYTYEMLMPDGKVLQGCTSHDLGQNFSKSIKVCFQNKNGKEEHVWQTSWGLSTRSIGGLIMMHGDDQGLVLPPKLAPVKVAIIPVLGKDDKEILAFAQKLKKEIEDEGSQFEGKVEVWEESEKSYGWKVAEAELRGVPLIIPVGAREVNSATIAVKYRINELEAQSLNVNQEKWVHKLDEMLLTLQKYLFEKSERFLKENTFDVESYEEFKKIMSGKKGFIRAFWCEDVKCEEKIKEETKASTRCLPLNAKKEKGECVYCGKEAKHRWLFGQSY